MGTGGSGILYIKKYKIYLINYFLRSCWASFFIVNIGKVRPGLLPSGRSRGWEGGEQCPTVFLRALALLCLVHVKELIEGKVQMG